VERGGDRFWQFYEREVVEISPIVSTVDEEVLSNED
jgi:hypothetical protein